MEQRVFNLGLFSVPDPKPVQDHELRACKSEKDAIWMMFKNARTQMSEESWAHEFDTTKGTFHLWINKQTGADGRRRNFPTEFLKRAIEVTGSLAIVQYLLRGTGYKIVKMNDEERLRELESDQKAQRIKELEEQIAKLRAA